MDIVAHQKPIKSPFHAKSTAAEVVDGHDLSGKTVVITGGYSGIGIETARALATAGAKIIVPARRVDTAKEALADFPSPVEVLPLDLADLKSALAAGEQVREIASKIDILINNAGIMACPEDRIMDGYDRQFGANHLGHFAFTMQLLPSLLNAGGRLVSLSSTAHRISPVRFDDLKFEHMAYDKWVAYGQSKTANSLFAIGFNARYAHEGVEAFAVHPGGIMTPLQRHLQTEEMVALGWLNPDGTMPEVVKQMFKSPEQGASTSTFAAVGRELEGLGGVYMEDCNIAQLADANSQRYQHISDYAVDREAAEKLWALSKAAIN